MIFLGYYAQKKNFARFILTILFGQNARNFGSNPSYTKGNIKYGYAILGNYVAVVFVTIHIAQLYLGARRKLYETRHS